MFRISAFNAKGAMLFLNGPDIDSSQTVTVDLPEVDPFISQLRSSWRWDADSMRFRRNRVTRIVVRSVGGGEEHYIRRSDGTAVQTAWLRGDGTELEFEPRIIASAK